MLEQRVVGAARGCNGGRQVTNLMQVPARWCQRGAWGHRAACTRGRAPERRCLGSRGRSCQTAALGQLSPGARAPQAATCWGWQRLALWQCCPAALPPQILLVPEAPLAAVLPMNPPIAHGQRSSCVGKVTPSQGRAATGQQRGWAAHSPGELCAGRACPAGLR